MSAYAREVSASERLYLVGRDLAPPFAIQTFVEGDGAIAPEHLEAAVARASCACPGARLVLRRGRWVDSGEAPRVRTVRATSFAGYDFERVRSLSEPLDPRRGPTTEVLVLEGAKRSTLVFRAFHGVMDGRGVLTWMEDIFRALADAPVRGAPSTRAEDDVLRALGGPKTRARLRPDSLSPFGRSAVDDTSCFFVRRTIPGPEPGLVAKLAVAITGAAGLSQTRFMVPVDLRRHDASIPSTANLSLPLLVEVRAGEPWEAVHERILRALAERDEVARDGTEALLGLTPRPLLAGFVRAALAHQRRSGLYLATGILSHLGRVDLSRFSCSDFAARSLFSLPVHAPLFPLSIVAVEHGRDVELTLAVPRGEGLVAKTESFLAALEDALARTRRLGWLSPPQAGPRRPLCATLSECFARQAAATPDATALVRGDVRLRYGELQRRAIRVGRALESRGIGPGSVVGVLAARDEHVIAGLLGVLAAGAAYLPLEPSFPHARIGELVSDAGVRLVLTSRPVPKAISAAVETLSLEALIEPSALAGAEDDGWSPPVPPVSADAAYVIYTSGSTGKSKGVEVEHGSLVEYAQFAARAYGLGPTTRFPLFTSLAFDLAVTALFAPLLVGGSVSLYPEALDHGLARRILEDEQNNALKVTPLHLDLFAQLGLSGPSIECVIVGGEQLSVRTARDATARFARGCRIFNEYGPTEATVGCTMHLFDPESDGDAPVVPIGRPVDGARIVLLGPDRAPVLPGEIGELFIGGPCLARGYKGSDALTAERFVFLSDGSRAYRSGDLARLTERGVLELVGRTDEQVKIRGYRVEPAEVSSTIESNGDVAAARVVLDPVARGLVAFVVKRRAISTEALRADLEARLPSYMVPRAIVFVDSLPLTANGKLDVRTLFQALRRGVPEEPPRMDVDNSRPRALESTVAEVWASVLAVDASTLGPGSDFYLLGGDSLKLIEMLARVLEATVTKANEAEVLAAMKDVIRRPTLHGVCRALARARTDATSAA